MFGAFGPIGVLRLARTNGVLEVLEVTCMGGGLRPGPAKSKKITGLDGCSASLRPWPMIIDECVHNEKAFLNVFQAVLHAFLGIPVTIRGIHEIREIDETHTIPHAF